MAANGRSGVLASKTIYAKLKMTEAITSQLTGLAGYLVDEGLLSKNQAKVAWQQALLLKQSFVAYLVQNKLVESSVLLDCCARHFGLPIFCLKKFNPQENQLHLLDETWVRRYHIIPLSKQEQRMKVGVSDPSDRSAFDALTFHTGLILDPVLVNEEDLNLFIDKHYNKNRNETLQLKVLQKITPEEIKTITQENNASQEEPLIQFVDHMLEHAKEQGASDVHIEPYEHTTRIRYRQDGLLYEIAQLQPHLATRVITRLKVLAELDIAERRLPQDGRFKIKTQPHTELDIRVSSCPTLHGEKIVLRLLDYSKNSLTIDSLGLDNAQTKLFVKKISQAQGLILVTGPTGSGKSHTLYSALAHLNIKEKNILTVEDPIEITLEGINQVPIHPRAGLHFSTALRSFLRQDPDIIMVGEIRDLETAQIALEAAQTGHLVLSTLHTNSALETVARLLSMGIAPYQLAQTVTLIIAQRLIRKLCTACKQGEMSSTRAAYPKQKMNHFRAYGCRHCRGGYQGRTAIFECLVPSEALIQLAIKNTAKSDLIKTARKEGFRTLWEIGMEKVQQGDTSFAELNRVLLQ